MVIYKILEPGFLDLEWTACGISVEGKKARHKWKYVTCKRCLQVRMKQERSAKNVRTNFGDSSAYLGVVRN